MNGGPEKEDYNSAPDGVTVGNLKPAKGIAEKLIGSFLATVDRVTDLYSHPSNLLALPLAHIDVIAKNLKRDEQVFTSVQGVFRLVTLDLGEPAKLIHPINMTVERMPQTAAALIFAAYVCEAAVEDENISAEGRQSLGQMFEVARAAAYIHFPGPAYKMLD